MESEKIQKQIIRLRIILLILVAVFAVLAAVGCIGMRALTRTGDHIVPILAKPSGKATEELAAPTPDPFAEALKTDVDYYETGEIREIPIYEQAKIDRFITSILVVIQNGKVDAAERQTDMIFIVSYNQLQQKFSIVSLSRDMLVPLDDAGWKRINAAYSLGGIGMLMNAINENLGLDMQNYVYTGTEELAALADGVGGIPATLTEAEAAYLNELTASDLAAGRQQLNGEQIVALLLDRTSDDKGDLGRSEKQLTVVTDTFSYLRKNFDRSFLMPFFTTIFQSVRTNLDFDTLFEIGYEMCLSNELTVATVRMPFDDSYSEMMLDGAYAILPEFEKNRILLRQALYGMEE